MRFSRRLPADLGPSPLQRRLAEFPPPLDLTESNPTRCGIVYPEAELDAVLASAAGVRYEPDPLGAADARAAVAELAAPPGVGADQIVLTASTSEAYSQLMALFCDPGDAVAVPAPSYPLLDVLAELSGARVERYRLTYEGRWRLDLGSLEQVLERGARLVVAVSPNNPTGSVVCDEEAEALVAVCRRYDVPLVADQVFAAYPFAPEPVPWLVAGDGPLTILLDGLSKRAGLPGVKAGWMIVTGRRGQEAIERLSWIADAHLSVSAQSQRALRGLLALAPRIQAKIHARVRANRLALQRAIATAPTADLLAADGGWTSVLRVPQVQSDDDWVVELVREAGLLLHPGYFYDFPSDGHLVLGLLVEPASFAAAARRVADLVASHG
jgi:aspartate/methionine/tyrosine aminotransferase